MKLWYGGGITSKSLSEIPDNINKMLGQYKKIATGTFLLDVTIKKSNTTKIYQHLSLIHISEPTRPY